MKKSKFSIILISGIIFGFGLALSNMAKPEVVLSFLNLQDLGLLLVLIPAAIISGITMHVLQGRRAPLTNLKYGMRKYPYGKNTIVGGIFFGIGWGISGVCPGAGFASLGMGNYPFIAGFIAMAFGASTYFVYKKFFPNSKIVCDHDRN